MKVQHVIQVKGFPLPSFIEVDNPKVSDVDLTKELVRLTRKLHETDLTHRYMFINTHIGGFLTPV